MLHLYLYNKKILGKMWNFMTLWKKTFSITIFYSYMQRANSKTNSEHWTKIGDSDFFDFQIKCT